jgi:LemA protein
MSFSRVIEFAFSFLVAFLALSILSFLSARPALQQTRLEAKADWEGLMRSIKERNEVLPSLAEALRGLDPSHAGLSSELLESRAIISRSLDADTILITAGKLDSQLSQIGALVKTNPLLEQHPTFGLHWKNILRISQKIFYLRRAYNSSARLYNRLLSLFPQNVTASIFGFVPLKLYSESVLVGE